MRLFLIAALVVEALACRRQSSLFRGEWALHTTLYAADRN